jgi:signal transduction histidine kinase
VRKHARASRVDITLTFQQDSVRLEIRDNGIGMAPDASEDGKFGLFGLRERMEILQGKCFVETKPGEGVCLAVELPAG